MIRIATVDDAKAICEIYNYYIANTIITFEESAVSEQEMAARIEKVLVKYPWLVDEENGTITGYAYASEWRVRAAYRNSVEATVYLANHCTGKGIGHKLYLALIERLKEMKFRVIIGGIALPNAASVALHEKLGFQKVAHFKEVGFKFGKWIDVGYWQLTNK